jgi:ribose transport system substrate-binding protein
VLKLTTRRGLALAVAAIAAVAIAACGSSSSSTTNSSTAAASGGGSGTTSNAAAYSSSPAGWMCTTAQNCTSADQNKVVVPGIPTLAQLAKGSYTQPPTSAPAGAKGKSIWWISCAQAAPSCAVPAEAAAQAAKALGLQFHVADGKNNVGGADAIAVRTALAAKPSAILLYGVECPATESALQQAKAEHVLVMGVETLDCNQVQSGAPQLFTASEAYSAKYPNTEAWWRGFGAFSADYIIDASNGHAKVIDNGSTEAGNTGTTDAGFLAEFKKCSGCSIVKDASYATADLTVNGPWIQAFRTALVQAPDATATYMPWDEMAAELGGINAITQSGHKIVAFGGQGAEDGMDLARKGLFIESATRPPEWSAYAAMDTINRLLQGQPPVDEGIGFQLVLPGTPMGAAGTPYEPAIAYKADYFKIWHK